MDLGFLMVRHWKELFLDSGVAVWRSGGAVLFGVQNLAVALLLWWSPVIETFHLKAGRVV